MQVTETLSEGLKREYRVVLPAADLERKIDEKLDELAQTVNINGFRPGKAPRALLRRRYEAPVRTETIDGMVKQSLEQVFLDHGVKPALQPKVDVVPVTEGADLVFTVAMETLPDIEPCDLKELQFTRLTAEVPEEQVEEALRDLARRERGFSPAAEDHEAVKGDLVTVSVDARDGDAPVITVREGFAFELGDSRFVTDFDEQLAGVKKGETRVFPGTFAEEYDDEDLAGKTVELSVTVSEVATPAEVELDDELAARFGMDSLEALRTGVRQQIQGEYSAASRTRLKREIMDTLAARHDFAVPTGLVDMEFANIWRQVEQDMEREKLTWEDAAGDEESTRAEYREIAERRVRLGLLMAEVGRRNDLTVPQEEVNRAMVNQARMFPGKEREIFEMFRSNPEMMNNLRAPLFEEKVVDFITEMAGVTDKEVSVKELLADPEENKDEDDAASA